MQHMATPLSARGGSSHTPPAEAALSDSGSRFGPRQDSSGAAGLWQMLASVVLGVVGLACLHGLLYHLHAILVPFVLSGFIVLALQPSVELLHGVAAGLRPPYRWCCCGPRRTQQRSAKRPRGQQPHFAPDGGTSPADQEVPPVKAEEEQEEWEAVEPRLSTAREEALVQVLDGLCRFLAVSIVLWGVLVAALLLFLMLCHGAMHMKDNWASYRAGLERLERLQDGLIDGLSREFHMSQKLDHRLKEGYYEIFSKAQEGIWTVVNSIVSSLSEGLSFTAILFLYVLFWLLTPLPTGGKAGALVRSYIYKKTLVSFFYGFCVSVLFVVLGVDLAVLFGVVSFFLNYVPEVGAFISMIVPIPVILLDGRLDNPLLVLGEALLGQLLLKFIFSNVLEVKLIERDREMSIHPVWVILGLSYFGFVWGPIGMLISVPMLSMLKTSALSAIAADVKSDDSALSGVPALAEMLLACIEGRRMEQHDQSAKTLLPKMLLPSYCEPACCGDAPSLSDAFRPGAPSA